jgi:16S rRNA (guanine527-N7)-methyltransferase
VAARPEGDDLAPATRNVSRETTALSFGGEAPSAPAEATERFGERLPLAVRYADHLAHAGVVRGLIGPREVERLWDRHLLNSAALADWVPHGSAVADVGAGAGLPGVPLALARPDVRVTLVEPLLRRATFLTEVVDDLGLQDQVEVVRARAEDLHGVRDFPIVTARAVAPLDRLAGWCLPLVRPRGCLLALKGQGAQEELDAARPVLTQLGAVEAEVVDTMTSTGPVRAVRIEKGADARRRPASSAGGPPRSRRRRGDGP